MPREAAPLGSRRSERQQDRAEILTSEEGEGNVLVLNYTLRCPLACDYCCYDCHPQRTEKMPLALALRLVDEAADLQVFSSIGLTGGEPMLFFDELLHIGDRCKRQGIPFTIVTSGFWAISPEEAHRKVSLLSERGLTRLSLSHDPSHARFVPRERILNAVKAGRSFGVTTQVVGAFDSDRPDLCRFAPELEEFPDALLASTGIARVGRGSQSPARVGLGPPGSGSLASLACIRQLHHDMVVFYDGRVWPCCSTFNLVTPGLCLGSVYEDSLQTLWQRLNGSLMLRVMKRKGFERLYEIVQEQDPSTRARLPTPMAMEDACSLCHRIFENEALAAALTKIFREYERDRTMRAVNDLTEIIGPEATSRLLHEIVPPEGGLPFPGPRASTG